MQFDIVKLAEQIKLKLSTVVNELDFLDHVAEYAKEGDLLHGHDVTFVKLEALDAMTEAIFNVRSSVIAGLDRIELTVTAHREQEERYEQAARENEEKSRRESEVEARKKYLRYARLFVLRSAIEDWLAEDKGVFLMAGRGIGPSRSVEDIIEQADYKFPVKDGDDPLTLQSWRRGYRGKLRADDHIELRRQYGSSGEEIVNPLAIPLWPLVSKDETDKWNKRFSRVLEMATNFDNGIHPEGFDSFRLDHWRPGEDW